MMVHLARLDTLQLALSSLSVCCCRCTACCLRAAGLCSFACWMPPTPSLPSGNAFRAPSQVRTGTVFACKLPAPGGMHVDSSTAALHKVQAAVDESPSLGTWQAAEGWRLGYDLIISSAALALLWLASPARSCMAAALAMCACAGAAASQSSILHVTLGRVLEARQLHRAEVEAIQAACR